MTDEARIRAALTALGPDGPDDAALNLDAALDDLRRMGKADSVILGTMERVVGQLTEAQEALGSEG